MALIERNTKSALYKGLSSFWLKYFKDSDQLNSVYAGAESLFGQVYLDLMEVILSKSLTNIPVFKKEEWKLLILQDDQLEFDPPVPSSHTFTTGSVSFVATADAIDPALDATSISFVDIANVREPDKEFFPSIGIFNHAHSGKSLNEKSWTVVVPSNSTIKDAITTVKKLVVSNQEITNLDVAANVTFTLDYDNGTTGIPVEITTAEQILLVTSDDLASLIETKINHPSISVDVQAGLLVITSIDKCIRIVTANEACEDLLFMTAFNFIIDAVIPLDLEDTLAWEYTYYIQLITTGFKQAGLEYRFLVGSTALDKTMRHTKFIVNTIYDPSIALEETKDYYIKNGYIYFKANPFDLDNVAFRVLGDSKQLAFWMSDVLYDNTLLYDRYGYRFTDPQEASEDYKLFLRGIIFYYTNGPDIASITSALNLVAGIPVILENGEVVVSIQSGLITTTKHSYEVPTTANPVVEVGQTVNAFDVLTDVFIVEDYIISPNWFANLSVPSTLMPGVLSEQRQLRESVSIPTIGDGSYIVGALDPSAKVLITDPISPYGLGSVPYALSFDAYFKIEIPDASISIPVYIPREYTSEAYTLDDLADVITKSIGQVSGVPFTGTTLDADATFLVNDVLVTVSEGVYVDIQEIIDLIATQLPENVKVRLSSDGERLIFISPTGANISITESSITAQVVLGIEGDKSFQGIIVSTDVDKLIFSNVSSESEALMRIVDISSVTLGAWSMKPFSAGSGEIVGEDGQPNLAYTIFDDILKYSTFKVTFSILDMSASTNISDLVDIVLSGKPKYVTPIISPVINFDDTLEHNELVVPTEDAGTFEPADPSIAEVYDVQKQDAIDITFSTLPEVRVSYDENFEEADFVILGNTGYEIPFNGGASILRVASKDNRTFTRTNHSITIGIQNNLAPEDDALFAFPGTYNFGVQTRGEPYPLTTVERVNLGAQNIGVYNADLSLVNGTYRSELDPRITHMFLLGASRPDEFIDTGFGEGDFLELKFWPDAGNNGRFSILNVSYGVETPMGTADILWFQNPYGVVDNVPGGKDPFDGSSYRYLYKSGNVSKKWHLTFPEGKLISEILAELESSVGDDREDFPFDLELVGPDVVWGTVAYTQFYTRQDVLEPRSFLGERHQLSVEMLRKIHIGETYMDYIAGFERLYLINPNNMLISDDYPTEDAKIIGFEDNIIGETTEIGTPTVYNRGELSAETQIQITTGDFASSPIPGYIEYLP